jgi:regulator of RNase E activity RraA
VATFEPVPADQLEGLRREDCTAVYNVMKFAGLADPDAYSGPELRCLFPDLLLPIVGYAMTSEWTAGEADAANADYLAWMDHMEASPGPKVAVMADIGSRPGRGGIVGDGMIAEYMAFGCVGAVIGGSVMDIRPMSALRMPVWATGVVPAYDQLRMASFGGPVSIGPLKIADGDIVMADEGGVIRIPRAAVPVVLEGMAAFRDLERSVAAVSRRPGLTAAALRAWYAQNEPEFLGDEDEEAEAGGATPPEAGSRGAER